MHGFGLSTCLSNYTKVIVTCALASATVWPGCLDNVALTCLSEGAELQRSCGRARLSNVSKRPLLHALSPTHNIQTSNTEAPKMGHVLEGRSQEGPKTSPPMGDNGQHGRDTS